MKFYTLIKMNLYGDCIKKSLELTEKLFGEEVWDKTLGSVPVCVDKTMDIVNVMIEFLLK